MQISSRRYKSALGAPLIILAAASLPLNIARAFNMEPLVRVVRMRAVRPSLLTTLQTLAVPAQDTAILRKFLETDICRLQTEAYDVVRVQDMQPLRMKLEETTGLASQLAMKHENAVQAASTAQQGAADVSTCSRKLAHGIARQITLSRYC